MFIICVKKKHAITGMRNKNNNNEMIVFESMYDNQLMSML